MNPTPLIPLVGAALDAALGDPQAWPHPVRAIGRVLDLLERPVRTIPAALQQIYGFFTAFLLSLGVYTAVWTLERIPGLGIFASLYFAYAGLALGQLLREAKSTARLIAAGDDQAARKALSMLVTRDTSTLDRSAQWRTLAETVSENFCDAFVAPFFYLCLGGAPLLWLYKTISTMDSMWGYKTPRFLHLGWAGAKADDLLAWLPARLSAWALVAAGTLLGLDTGGARANMGRDAATMDSPNAGWPMSAAAWLCGASMGGKAVYFGRTLDKPILGPKECKWNEALFKTLFRLLVVASSLLFAVAGIFLLSSAMLIS